MRRGALVLGTVLVLVAALVAASFPPATNVQADNLLQDAPILEG